MDTIKNTKYTLFNALAVAITLDDFDEAIIIIQDSLGGNSFNADIWFEETTIYSHWEKLSSDGRFSLMRRYIAFEVMFN